MAVDDNLFNLIPLEVLLGDMYKLGIDKACDGQQAVSMVEQNFAKGCCTKRYELILMDLNMPVMDGY